MTRIIATHVAAIAAVVCTIVFAGNFLTLLSEHPIRALSVALLLVVTCALAAIDICGEIKRSPTKYSGSTKDAQARAYMTRLVTENSGRCAISSNNLSWVTGDAKEAMQKKAADGELEIIMPQENAVSKELCNMGADVHYYGNVDGPLESRFTIVNFERSGQWAAVSHEVEGVHIIRKIRSGDDPTLFLARDLFNMTRRHAEVISAGTNVNE